MASDIVAKCVESSLMEWMSASKCGAALSDYGNIYYYCDVILINVTYTQSDYAVWKCNAKITHMHKDAHIIYRLNYVLHKAHTFLIFHYHIIQMVVMRKK